MSLTKPTGYPNIAHRINTFVETPKQKQFHFITDAAYTPCRLDQLIALHLSEISRSAAAQLIRNGRVTVDGKKIVKPAFTVTQGQLIGGGIPPPEPVEALPEAIEIDVLYADDQLIVVNKAAGMVVHPAPGHTGGTLVNALLHHFPCRLEAGGHIRPGIVHRLDKETSGCLLVARTDLAHQHLTALFKSRRVQKKYLAVVVGNPDKENGRIDLPIGRHPALRKQMSVNAPRSRRAETHWKVSERFGNHALLALDLKTGRTHQIRVHLSAMGHPVLGDTVYGKKQAQKPPVLKNGRHLPILRQMLHAWKLGIAHPESGLEMTFTAPLPKDMVKMIAILKEGRNV